MASALLLNAPRRKGSGKGSATRVTLDTLRPRKLSSTSSNAAERRIWQALILMRRSISVLSLLLCLASASTPARADCASGASPAQWVDGGGTCLAISVAGAETAGTAPKLVVLLHGDVSAGGPADYLYPFATSLAKPGIVVVALLRPGYYDAAGHTSQGTNHNRRDSYTPANVTIVGKAIVTLKARYNASSVVAMGHSGGAAIAAVLLGRQPGLIDAAVLVACPCIIPRWLDERGARPFPNSLSPHKFVASVPKTARVRALTGTEDDNTRSGQVGDYIGMLRGRGIDASASTVRGAGHGFTRLGPPAAAAVAELL